MDTRKNETDPYADDKKALAKITKVLLKQKEPDYIIELTVELAGILKENYNEIRRANNDKKR